MLFFIIGWGKQTFTNHGPIHQTTCGNCNNTKHWVLLTRRSWVTFFFIPIIPYSNQHLAVCPVCNRGIEVGFQEFRTLEAIAKCNTEYAQGVISINEYESRMKQLRQSGPGSESLHPDFIGKTETQINYIRQMQEIEKERDLAKQAEETTDKPHTE